MYSVFQTDELCSVAVKDLKVYAILAPLSRRLSNDIVRKSLLTYITNTITHIKSETVNGYNFYKNDTSTWVGNRLHREGGPAFIRVDGAEAWWRNGKLHRENGPAIIWADGDKEWWRNGRRHRDDDGPTIIRPDGGKEWWYNGVRHRENGPAVIYTYGYKEWWHNGKRLK